jgi:hypothetical protein
LGRSPVGADEPETGVVSPVKKLIHCAETVLPAFTVNRTLPVGADPPNPASMLNEYSFCARPPSAA